MLWLMAISYSIMENCHFGWNFVAKSDMELVCDGFQALLLMIAIRWSE